MQVTTQPWMHMLSVPQPPAPPSFGSVFGPASPATGEAPAHAEAEKASSPPRESIGVSPVVQAFLLRLQELGMASLAGTDGADTLKGWSSSLADAGSGDDSVDVWSNSVVDAGDGDDSVRAWSDSAVYGGNGDDQIDVWSGSVADGGGGDDVIRAWSDTAVAGGDGDDAIDAWSNSKVDGGSGNDRISAWSNSVVDGGDGDDVIQAHAGSVVTGGRGNDTIVVRSDSVVRFSSGDGQDTIHAGTDTKIQLGQDMAAERTRVEIAGNTATIRFDDSADTLTVHLRAGNPASLSFADGTTLSLVGEPIRSELGAPPVLKAL
ncbi:MAG TPA: hypothetical protein VGN60_01815 [Devosia sp.]|jgi:hypothetical protein|nr:hypothetical protein [Devosia sp.]